jgi:hypothetical protein
MKNFANVAVDHPEHSSGDNPGVMFDCRGKRWAIAVKTAFDDTRSAVRKHSQRCGSDCGVKRGAWAGADKLEE